MSPAPGAAVPAAPRSSFPRRAAGVLATAAARALVGALALDLAFGASVTLLHGLKTEAEREEWRRLRAPGDDPLEIYGQPEGPPLRVLVWDRTRLVEAPEAGGQRLLPTDRGAGDVPLQSRTLWRWALTLALPLLAVAALLALRARSLGRFARAGLPLLDTRPMEGRPRAPSAAPGE